ncbi:MAG: glycosyltransferase family 4 protein [Saprospiraceae bacterium]|nr:glycosyltransferase family 4 protein [Saprospiraceae bacterium]
MARINSNKKLTIALVANTTWNIYNFRLNLIDKFIDEGHEVAVIAPMDEYIFYKDKYPTIRHFNLRMLDRDGTNPLRDMMLILELTRKFRRIKPDIVLHFTNKPNIYGAISSKMAGVKHSVAVVTGLGYAFIHDGFTHKLLSLMYKWTGRFHQKFIFENLDDRQLFVNLNIVKEINAIAVKGCGVNIDYFYPFPNGQIKAKTTFTFIGRLLYDKGIREFVNAAKIINEKYPNTAEFWVIGELDDDNPATVNGDDVLDWVNNKIIRYWGFVKDVRPLLSKSDCVVLPSYREGLPRIVLEALAMAKPVITTDTPGCRETVFQNENGWLIPSRNTEALVECIENFLSLGHDKRHEMGNKGREFAESIFNDKLIARQIYDEVKNLI